MISKAATLPQSFLGKRIAAVALGMLALAGLGGSPALALPLTGVGTAGRTVITKTDPCQPPTTPSFTANPPEIALGTSSTLVWNVPVAAGCSYALSLGEQPVGPNGIFRADGNVGPQGSFEAHPILDTNYSLTVVWGPGVTQWTRLFAGVQVDLPADPTAPNRFKVTITNPPSLDLFLKGLMTPNTTVVVDNAVELDLSGLEMIQVAKEVLLMGGRMAVPGKPYQPGPRLFTRLTPSRLFDVEGTGVRITGLRIQGRLSIDPPEIASDEYSTGISIGSHAWDPAAPIAIEIDHNEIYGWSDSAVEVLGRGSEATAPVVASSFDAATLLLSYAATPETAYVHDNYFHHNLHKDGHGYGVVVSNSGHALIERNVFDWNRHAISGDGSDFSGYRAYRNMVLEHGGQNAWVPPLAGWEYTQQFDMHGQQNCGVLGWLDNTQKNCGTAGHDMDIRYNSFLYTAAQAIKVRGTPQLATVVGSNVFAHDYLFDVVVNGLLLTKGAVEWNEAPLAVRGDNQLGVHSWYAIDQCDFDGDGIPDRFLTTGQTWWFSSNRGQGPWIYLNTSTLTLDRGEVTLVDGGSLCEVVAGGVTYRFGTTSPSQFTLTTPAKARLLGQ